MLGIDPGLRRTGYALLERSENARTTTPRVVEAGVFALDASTSVPARLGELDRDLGALIERGAPDGAAIEKLYAHYEHPTTAIAMGHARGVILLALDRAGVSIHELASTEVKKAVTGNGHASKQQVGSAVASVLGLGAVPEPSDVSDAMAIALVGLRRTEV